MEERHAKEQKSFDVDLTIPLKMQSMPEIKETDCFGKLWDMTSKECPQCADRDVCGIIFKDKVDTKAKEMEAEMGTKYLDEADLQNITDDKLIAFIESGKTTAAELISYGMDLGYCDDVLSVKRIIVEFIKKSPNISVKGGIVWMD